MRAAKMKERPSFQLMCQTDIQNIYHMQMPRWLFSDPRYAEMSLDAKVAYTFLLNRFQLSRRNGWVNEHGEVFVIFPRKALAHLRATRDCRLQKAGGTEAGMGETLRQRRCQSDLSCPRPAYGRPVLCLRAFFA